MFSQRITDISLKNKLRNHVHYSFIDNLKERYDSMLSKFYPNLIKKKILFLIIII